MHSRRRLYLETGTQIRDFVNIISNSEYKNDLYLENKDGSCSVSANSILGVVYAATEFYGEIYIVNHKVDAEYPHELDRGYF